MRSETRPQLIRIESRLHLLSTLAEAAELEHALMCLYLYAVFSLKQTAGETLATEELEAVKRWRATIMEVAVQEMTHLALVSNLSTALGGHPHFRHPALPVAAGYFPAGFVLELAPFDLDLLDHFIFLERPAGEAVRDGDRFAPIGEYHRPSPRGRLMSTTGDYETVGQLYEAVSEGLRRLCAKVSEEKLFCGTLTRQLGPEDVSLEGLRRIGSLRDAEEAITTIVEQGEGARREAGSHYEKFQAIRTEYLARLRANPKFAPAREAARNPAMRRPIKADGDCWIEEPFTAEILDLGNAIYNFMLACLRQSYCHAGGEGGRKAVLLDNAFSAMHALGAVGSLLSRLPAGGGSAAPQAGLTFSLNRHNPVMSATHEQLILGESSIDIMEKVIDLLERECSPERRTSVRPSLQKVLTIFREMSPL